MTFSVQTIPEAEENIEESAAWWAKHHSPEQAARWFDGVWDAIHSLSDRPEQWPTALENDDFPYEIREYHYGLGSGTTHRIIFTISNETVHVLSVWHTSRDRFGPHEISFSR